jgi:hypothetical protein
MRRNERSEERAVMDGCSCPETVSITFSKATREMAIFMFAEDIMLLIELQPEALMQTGRVNQLVLGEGGNLHLCDKHGIPDWRRDLSFAP